MNDIEKIFIDLDDEITFVIERIRQSDNKRILLIVPDRAAILSSVVSLKLILRYCFRNDKDLIIVTTDELGMNIAAKAGIVCVSKVSEIDELLWDKAAAVSVAALAAYKALGQPIAQAKETEEIPEENVVENTVKEPPINDGIVMTATVKEIADELEQDDISEVANEEEVEAESILPEESKEVLEEDQPEIPVASEVESSQEKVVDNSVKEVNGFVMSSGGDISKVHKAALPASAAVAAKTIGGAKPVSRGNQSMQTQTTSVESGVGNIDTVGTAKTNPSPKQNSKNSLVGKDITSYSFKTRRKVKRNSSGGAKVKMPKVSKPSFAFLSNKSNLKFIAPIAVIFVLLFGYAYFIAPKADVNLTLEAKQLEAAKEVKASPDYSSIDLEKLTIPAQIIESNVDGSKNAKATGKKQIGEKAKGEVTLFNFTTNDVNLAAGTIVASGDKKFLLDVDVTIPKKNTPSPDNPEEPILAGTRDVTVTAQTFGADYNLKDGALFTVANYGSDQVKGKTFKDFAGGTSKEITIVSSSDIDKLQKTILDELKPQAIEKVKSSIGEDKFFLEDQIKFDVKESTSSPAKDQEGDNFDLSIKAVATVTVFNKADLDQLAEELLKSQVEEGYNLDENTYDVSSELLKADGTSLTIKLNIKAIAQKEFDQNGVADEISGKGVKKAGEKLSEQSAVKDYEITVKPSWLFGPFKHLPGKADKINMQIQYEDLTVQDTEESDSAE